MSARQRRDLGTPRRAARLQTPHYDPETFGRFSEGIARYLGTARFLFVQTIIVSGWIVANVWLLHNHGFDPYPFILLNLAFSTQAAYTGPVLLLAGNRQAQKDRLTLEHAAHEADKADRQNVQILRAIEHNTEVTVQILKHVEVLISGHMASDEAAQKQRRADQT